MTFRLKQQHSKNLEKPRKAVDGVAVIAAQSVRKAIVAALVTTLVFNISWLAATALVNRVFPWFVLVQALFIGFAVRRWGQGIDWRFPAIAAVFALLAAYSGNFLLAADAASKALDVGLFEVLFGLTAWTFDTYFEEVVSPADHIYAAYGAGLAAFLARRKLTRSQEFAVRTIYETKADTEDRE